MKSISGPKPHVRLQRAVPDRDDVPGTDEDVGFAELDRAPGRHELGGTEHDEQRVVVLLDLGPLVGGMRILDGEIVKAELPLHARQDVRARLVQANPDEPIVLPQRVADSLDREVRDAAPA
jgi:hypothetical protein